MEDNLHKKLIESDDLYGDYKLPNDALSNFRKYEVAQSKTIKTGFYKYLFGLMTIVFLISNAYWISEKYIQHDLNPGYATDISEKETNNQSAIIAEGKSPQNTVSNSFDSEKLDHDSNFKMQTADIKSNSNINSKNSTDKEISTTFTSQEKNILPLKSDRNIGFNKENDSSFLNENLTSKIQVYDSEVTENTSSSSSSSSSILDNYDQSQSNQKANTNIMKSASDLSSLLLDIDMLPLPGSSTIFSLNKAEPIFNFLLVNAADQIEPIDITNRKKYSASAYVALVSQSTNKYPSLKGKQVRFSLGKMISQKVRTRLGFSFLHQNGNVRQLEDLPLYAFDTPLFPDGAAFQKLNFDRLALGINIGLDYYLMDLSRFSPYVGLHYYLEGSRIEDIHNFYKSSSLDDVDIRLPNGDIRLTNYLVVQLGFDTKIWRQFSISLESQYLISLRSEENSYFTLGAALSYRF